MIYALVLLLFSGLTLSSCLGSREPMPPPGYSPALDNRLGYNDLVAGMPPDVVRQLTERPDEHGALGRNQEAYVHVRFQINLRRLSDYAIRFQSEEALTEYLKSLAYSFSYQNPAGDFQFVAPDYLVDDPAYSPPSEANLASGTAFFAYSLGISLQSLTQSEWYEDSPTLADQRKDVDSFRPAIERTLAYLKRSADQLTTVDTRAPNRLLFNAIAFYSLGLYLNDPEAIDLGISFANAALRQRDPAAGYFVEGGGWDASYNGVATQLALELFTLIPEEVASPVKHELAEAATGAARWQQSRVLPSGEISTEGNTRVFPGGERFLGREKEVDVIKTVRAFFYLSTLADEDEYGQLAQRIIAYYQ